MNVFVRDNNRLVNSLWFLLYYNHSDVLENKLEFSMKFYSMNISPDQSKNKDRKNDDEEKNKTKKHKSKHNALLFS